MGNRQKEFIDLFDKLAYKYGNAWTDFVILSACTLSNLSDRANYSEREDLYKKTIEKYSPADAETFAALFSLTAVALAENPRQDFLGELYGKLCLNKKGSGQFFTPYHIGELMAMLTLPEEDNEEITTIPDPCCGAGCLLIAAANHLVDQGRSLEKYFFIGQDIDYTAALMCYVQLSLLGCRGAVKIGDSLSDPYTANEKSSKVWYMPGRPRIS